MAGVVGFLPSNSNAIEFLVRKRVALAAGTAAGLKEAIMNMTLAYLKSRRAWLVESYKVWGTESEADLYLATMEKVDSEHRIGLWHVALGGYRQEVKFTDLVDKRGNHLPQEINQPAVIVIPRESSTAYVKAVAGNSGFIIAKSEGSKATVMVDLMIFETGI